MREQRYFAIVIDAVGDDFGQKDLDQLKEQFVKRANGTLEAYGLTLKTSAANSYARLQKLFNGHSFAGVDFEIKAFSPEGMDILNAKAGTEINSLPSLLRHSFIGAFRNLSVYSSSLDDQVFLAETTNSGQTFKDWIPVPERLQQLQKIRIDR